MPSRQSIHSAHVEVSESGGIQLYPVRLRYAFPAELDLMARLAGMRLRARYGGWNRESARCRASNHFSLSLRGCHQHPRAMLHIINAVEQFQPGFGLAQVRLGSLSSSSRTSSSCRASILS